MQRSSVQTAPARTRPSTGSDQRIQPRWTSAAGNLARVKTKRTTERAQSVAALFGAVAAGLGAAAAGATAAIAGAVRAVRATRAGHAG